MPLKEHIAHIRYDEDGTAILQTVREHSFGCAREAADSVFHAFSSMAYLAGLLHDMGKCTDEFDCYIKAGGKESGRKVTHSFTGVKYVLEKWHAGNDSYSKMTAEIIAYAIGSHHGLFDSFNSISESGFVHRCGFDQARYDEACKSFFEAVIDEEALDSLFVEAVRGLKTILGSALPIINMKSDTRLPSFHIGFISRVVSSAVIEGDRHDTAAFMTPGLYDSSFKVGPYQWKMLREKVEASIAGLPDSSRLDSIRKAFSEEATRLSERKGVYRLSIPTGGGKTLTSLRMALRQAEAGRRRIIYAIPLLSILEQNAAVIRDAVGDDRWIVEHHSNVVSDVDDEADDRMRIASLLTESWSAPIVLTTLVQLLDTLFSAKTSCVRRMAALTGSVIIIDEVQSVPRKMLALFNQAMNFLAYFCDCQIILCSATQPRLDYVEESKLGIQYAPEADVVRFDEDAWSAFRRTEILDDGKYYACIEDVAKRIIDASSDVDSLLVVCNTRKEALGLYRLVSMQTEKTVVHLSTSMCMAHRRQTVAALRRMLDDGDHVICISTQLIEAGVDISFRRAMRFCAGLDSIIQTAGRCNRNGESDELGQVEIIRLRNENLNGLPDIDAAALAYTETYRIMGGRQLEGCKAVDCYYRQLYSGMKAGETEYILKKFGVSLFDLLSTNSMFAQSNVRCGDFALRQAFRTAGDSFRVFEDDRTDVLVPYGKGIELARLFVDVNANDLRSLNALVKEARQYTVPLFRHEIDRLASCGGLSRIESCDIFCLSQTFYDEESGVVMDFCC